MSLRASLSVLLGCQFGQASKLLDAAEHGQVATVKEVLESKPQLAAYSGFHGTTTPLHRAAAGGHLDICCAIIDLIKARIDAAESAAQSVKQRASSGKRWRALLRTVINQRTNRGLTPLMVACEHGHAAVAAFFLAEGADPLCIDMFHCRTALHWAAMGGHADCVRVLCSDATTVVGADGIARPLRDVVSTDLQVHTSKFIDQRSFGGLTPLHFAAVSGDLDTMQVLLHAGAATMVKTDGEAFIGDDYLTPGSTPLHIAVLVGSVPLAHALLQAHAQLMTLAGSGRDERRRRPWEGHSRTDVRSMRNAQRKLPYHLARERGRQQLTHLVDPRVSIDAALDAARDTEHGIGPKHLSTICSLVLQTSLLGWLDQCQEQMRADKERAAADTPVQEQQAAQRTTRRSWSMTSLVGLRVPSSNTALPAEGDSNAAVVHLAAPEPVVDSGDRSPFATAQEAASEPTTPRDGDSMVGVPPGGAATAPAVPSLEAARLDSLHAYVGMLSKKRVVPLGSPARGMRPDRCATLDGSGLPFGRPSAPVAPRMPRASSTGALQRLAVPALADEDGNGGMQPGAMRRALSTLRGRLLSSDSHNAGCDDGSGHGFSMSKDDSGSGCGGSSGGKGTGFDTDSTVCGSVCSEDCGDSAGVQDKECGVCLDHVVEVAFSGCEHALCLECARHLTKQDKKPPSCPFCRRMVVGFTRVPAANRVVV